MQAPLPFEENDASQPPLRAVVLGSGSGGNAVVVEWGTHPKLLEKKGMYANLYHSQYSSQVAAGGVQ